MRKVTHLIKQAFEQGKSKKVGNTRTDGENVWLHGNLIIKRDGKDVMATLAGWNTPTTRERVNGITGLSFHQVDFEAMLDGESVGTRDWISVTRWKEYVLDRDEAIEQGTFTLTK